MRTGPPDSPDSAERFAGFCEALRQAGLPVPDSAAATGGFTEAGGRQAVAALLAAGRRPGAIVCGNDEMAIGALTALRARRLRIPADVALTGFDDIAAAGYVVNHKEAAGRGHRTHGNAADQSDQQHECEAALPPAAEGGGEPVPRTTHDPAGQAGGAAGSCPEPRRAGGKAGTGQVSRRGWPRAGARFRRWPRRR
jgi:Periplasmic binding protein-like domain